MATSSAFSTSSTYVVYEIVVTENSTSVTDNTSNVTVKVNFWRTNTGYTTYGTGTVYCTINGTNYSQAVTTSQTITSTKRTLFSKTLNIPHNSNGSKSLTCSAYINLGSILSSDSHSFTTALGTIPRASTISSVTSSVTVDGTNTSAVSITRKSSSFTHKVTWSIGSYSYTEEDVGTSTSYAIPMSWLNSIPSATSGTAKVKVETYSGSTKIGLAVSANFTIKVPTSVIPSISSITTTRVDGTVPSSWGIYVKGKSKCKLTINGFAGVYGSTASSYNISNNGTTLSSSSSYTTGYLNTTGTISYVGKVIDSRGRSSATKTTSIVVYDYSSPSFIYNTSAVRCDADGTINANGTCIKASPVFVFSSCNSKNNAVCTVKYKLSTASSWSDAVSVSSGGYAILGGGNINPDNAYNIMFTLTDAFTTVTKTMTVRGTFKTLNFRNGGKGIAIGKKSTSNIFEVDLSSKFNKQCDFEGDINLKNGSLIYPSGTYSSGCNVGYDVSTSSLRLQNQSSSILISNSSITINSLSLTITASTWATGTGTPAYITSAGKIVKYSSSAIYKTNFNYNINKMKYHNELMKLKPIEYSYKSSLHLTERGMIAEDVEEINPDLVVYNNEGKVESYKDRDIATMLIVEAQEKDKMIQQQQNQINELTNLVNDIYSKLNL